MDNFPNVFDSLPGNLAARAKALVVAREAKGANVHFIRENGTVDRFSFRDRESADKFRTALRRAGLAIVEGN